MRNHALLLKKQLLDAFPAKRSKKRLPDLTSALLMLLLTGAMVAIFVFVFSRFISTYTQIKINRVPDIAARQYEIMSMGYFVLVVVFVINGVNALCHALFENSDLSILISMPFSSSEIFLSKLTAVYLKQAVLALVCVPTLNFTFLCTTDTLNVYNGIMTFAVALLLPIIPLGIASIVVLPYYYLKRLANSHYIFVFIVMTAGMALFCWLYSYVFRFAQDLISSGKITSLFGDKTMRFILSFTKYDYPANLFVAGFIGSPQMNFFTVKLQKEGNEVAALFGDNKIIIPPSKLSKFADESYIGKEIYMGIRPENIHDEDVFIQAAPNAVVDCNVEVTELMGSETYLYLSTSGKEENIIARVNPRTTSRAGQTVQVAFDVNHLHFFDKETEKNLF